MSKKLFYSLFLTLVVWSVYSLSYSPIAWYDEVFYASTTHSLMNGNGLTLEIDHYEPVLMYGPIYFFLTSVVMKLFGFGIFQFRVVNLLFSFFSVLLLGKILNKLNVSKGMNYFIQILMLTDALFFANSHSGRMEFVALFFILASYWIYLCHFNRDIVKALLISILLTLAILTTLRVVVICIPIAIAQLIKFIKSRSWDCLVVYCLIPIILYGIWVFAAFGSVSEMVSYFTQAPADGLDQKSLFERFAKGNWLIAKYHYPLVLAALLSIFFLSKKGKITNIIVYLTPIILYYILVKDTGLYGVLILPFYFIIIALGISETSMKFRISCKSILALYLFVNCTIMIVKVATIVSSLESRNPYKITAWVKKNIPYGSKVVGDCAYYYAAIDNGCQFKRIGREGEPIGPVLEEIKKNFQPEFIILLENNKYDKHPSFNLFNAEVNGYYKFSKDNELVKILKKVGVDFRSSYDGRVYKIKN